MIINKERIEEVQLAINEKVAARVSIHTYLGTLLHEQLDRSQEIKARIEKSRAAFIQMFKPIKTYHLILEMKIRLLRCHKVCILSYGVEFWILTKVTTKRLRDWRCRPIDEFLNYHAKFIKEKE